jgi:tetratricopeptide (TPR) repeat protein
MSALLFIVLAGFPTLAEPSPFQKGLDALTAGEVTRAEEAFTTCINDDIHKQAAYVNRAVTRLKLGRVKDALADLEEALRLDPDDPVALFNRAVGRLNTGLKPSVLTDLNRARELVAGGKGGPEARAIEGRVTAALEPLNGAMTAVRAYSRQGNQAEAELTQAEQLRSSGAFSVDDVDLARARVYLYRSLEAGAAGDREAERKYLTQEINVLSGRYKRFAELVAKRAEFPDTADMMELDLRRVEVELARADGRAEDVVAGLKRIVAIRQQLYDRAVASRGNGNVSREDLDGLKRLLEDSIRRVKLAQAEPVLPANRGARLADVAGQPILRRLPSP